MLKTAIIADDDPISRAKVEEWAIQQNYKIIAFGEQWRRSG